MNLSQLGLEDMALYLGPLFLLDQDEEALSPSSSLEGQAPASPPPFLSFPPPPTHPSLFLGDKVRADPLSLPWLVGGDLFTTPIGAGDDDSFEGMDWMLEKINLSEFDEDPCYSKDLLASLDSHMDPDVDSLAGSLSSGLPLPLEAAEETEVVPDQQLVSESELPLTSEDEPPPASIPDCDSDSGIESIADSPARLPSPEAGSSRTKPYSRPEPSSSSPSAKTPRVKSVSGAPKVEKKMKKMEQNKTAATRYRQKKRVEQDLLHVECDKLEKRNNELAEKAESISREIQYLNDLMEEVRKRRVKSSSVAMRPECEGGRMKRTCEQRSV